MSNRSSVSESPRRNHAVSSSRMIRSDERDTEGSSQSGDSPKRSLLNRIFGSHPHREKLPDVVAEGLMTNEGTITNDGWTDMRKGSPSATRLHTVKLIQQRIFPLQKAHFKFGQLLKKKKIMPVYKKPWILRMNEATKMQLRNSTLQVSTLEGIWHETRDLLNDKEMRDALLRAYIDVTHTQYNQLGLALRHTFFVTIVRLGMNELTVKWLSELSAMGQDSSGFEPDMDDLIISWTIRVTQVEEVKESAEWPKILLKMVQEYVRCNSAFVAKDKVFDLVYLITMRISDRRCTYTEELFEVLKSILEHHEVSCQSSSMFHMTILACIMITIPRLKMPAWRLARNIITSKLANSALHLMVDLLEIGPESNFVSKFGISSAITLKKGVITIIATSFWCAEPVSTQHYTWCPSIYLLAFETAAKQDPGIAKEVLIAIEMLLSSHGIESATTTWPYIINTVRTIIKLMTTEDIYRTTCLPAFDGITLVLDRIHKEEKCLSSMAKFFKLIYEFQEFLPLSSPAVLALIEYRVSTANPRLQSGADELRKILMEYMNPKQGQLRRSRMIELVHKMYTEHRLLNELAIIENLVMPMLTFAMDGGEDPDSQYQMMVVLLDVMRNVSVRCGVNFNELLNQFGRIVRDAIKLHSKKIRFMDGPGGMQRETKVLTTISPESMEAVLQQLDEVVRERWNTFDSHSLRLLSDILRRHIMMQYNIGWISNRGAETRARCFNMLLSFQVSPMSCSIVYWSPNRLEIEVENPFIRRRPIAEIGVGGLPPSNRMASDDGWTWADICETCETGIRMENWWPVLVVILKNIGRILELPETVRTSEESKFSELAHGLIGLFKRADQFETFVECRAKDNREELMHMEVRREMAKYLPPVMSTLLNYTKKPENRHNICDIILECVKIGSSEAIAACDVAIQLVPEIMCQKGNVLINCLMKMKPAAHRAIPVIELLSDAADTSMFHNLFYMDDFKRVASILAPYLDVSHYNPFVAAAVHRILMRWYVQSPNKWRCELQSYFETLIDDIASPVRSRVSSEASNSSTVRQPSGDGRQYPGEIFVIGEVPSDSSLTDLASASKAKDAAINALKLIDEMRKALGAFFQSPEIVDAQGDCELPDNLYELSHECFSTNDTIITVRSFVELEKETIKALENTKKMEKELSDNLETMSTGGLSTRRHSMVSRQGSLKSFSDFETAANRREMMERDTRRMTFSAGTGFMKKEMITRQSYLQDMRRRYQTTIGGSNSSGSGNRTPESLKEDVEFTLRRGSASVDPVFNVPETAGYLREQEMLEQELEERPSFTQMICRHMYGKTCWLMRSMDYFPPSFDKSNSLPVNASSLLHHISTTCGARRLARPSDIVQLERSLRILDKMPASESHDVGVVYVGPYQNTEKSILANIHGSARYLNFLELLGEKITLENCPGGLQEGIHGTYTYQYQDEMSTITYLIATLMKTDPVNDPNCNWKKKLIGNNFVTVVWNESGQPFKMNRFCRTFVKAAIELIPHDENHILIQVHAKQDIACWLAMRRSLIGDEHVPMFLRKLIVRTQLSVNVKQQSSQDLPYISRGVERLRKIRQMIEKFSEVKVMHNSADRGSCSTSS